MLSAATLKKIASLLKVQESDLDSAIKATEEKEVEIADNLHVFNQTEYDTLKNNEYKSGKEKGIEMAVKESRDKLGLDFSGKTIDGLLESYNKKILADAKKEPSEKVAELESKVKTLQSTVQDYEAKLTEKDTEVSSIRTKSELLKHIPKLSDKAPALDQDDIITMMKSKGYEFKIEDGKIITTKDGNVIQDKLSNPLSAKDIIDGFLREKKFIIDEGTPGGRGDAGSGGAFKASKLSELKQQFEKEGKNTLGQEFSQAAQAAVKENPDFDLNA